MVFELHFHCSLGGVSKFQTKSGNSCNNYKILAVIGTMGSFMFDEMRDTVTLTKVENVKIT